MHGLVNRKLSNGSSYYLISPEDWFKAYTNVCRPFKIGLIGCPKTSVSNYHYTMRNNSEERSSHVLRGGSLKS